MIVLADVCLEAYALSTGAGAVLGRGGSLSTRLLSLGGDGSLGDGVAGVVPNGVRGTFDVALTVFGWHGYEETKQASYISGISTTVSLRLMTEPKVTVAIDLIVGFEPSFGIFAELLNDRP